MSIFDKLKELLGRVKGEPSKFPPRMFCVICGARNQWVGEGNRVYRCANGHRFDLDYKGPPLPPKEKPTGEI